MLQNTLINHVSLIVDKSGSMDTHAKKVVEVFDKELNGLKRKSIDLNQETRISIYLYDDNVEILAFDMDVMRFSSLRSFYQLGGRTALIDATVKSILDHRKLPELYGDHAFFQYLITDGEENASRYHGPDGLREEIGKMKDNWTTAVLVPNKMGVEYAKRCGFNVGAISTWDTSHGDAFEGVGQQFHSVMDNYMAMRSKGVRGTKNIFEMSTANLMSVKDSGLRKLRDNIYEIIPVRKDSPIKEYIENFTGKTYCLGSAYYQPTKPVIIQDHKNIFIQKIKDGRVYEGDQIRSLLGLPEYTAKITPGDHKGWRIFVQSTSVNRKLIKDTFVLVMK